jgi:hypothetical protein
MQKYYSYVRNQINKPNQFLDPNVPHSTKGLSSAASSYMSFSGAVRAQLEKKYRHRRKLLFETNKINKR